MRNELSDSDRPERVALDVNGQQVVFVRVGNDQYAAERNGKRLRVRRTTVAREEAEWGGRESGEPNVQEGATTNIDALLYALSLGAVPEPPRPTTRAAPDSQGVVPSAANPPTATLSASDNWGHYRQWTFLTITVTLVRGVVHIHEVIGEQDGSYY